MWILLLNPGKTNLSGQSGIENLCPILLLGPDDRCLLKEKAEQYVFNIMNVKSLKDGRVIQMNIECSSICSGMVDIHTLFKWHDCTIELYTYLFDQHILIVLEVLNGFGYLLFESEEP